MVDKASTLCLTLLIVLFISDIGLVACLVPHLISKKSFFNDSKDSGTNAIDGLRVYVFITGTFVGVSLFVAIVLLTIPRFLDTCSGDPPPKTSPNGNDAEKQEWNGIISGCELNCD